MDTAATGGRMQTPETGMPGAQRNAIADRERERLPRGHQGRGSQRSEPRSEGSDALELRDSANAEQTGASDASGNERGTDGGCAFAEDETQLAGIRELMTRASARGVWLTLGEIAEATEFAEASISAQLRHLRKAHNGGHRVEKRRRAATLSAGARRQVRNSRRGPVIWEYRVQSPRASRTGTGADHIPSEAAQADAAAAGLLYEPK